MSKINLLQNELDAYGMLRVEAFSFPAMLCVKNDVSECKRDVRRWEDVWRILMVLCSRTKEFKRNIGGGNLPWIVQSTQCDDGEVRFLDTEQNPWKLTVGDSLITRQVNVANTLRLCGFGSCVCSLENQDDEDIEWLHCLNYKVKECVDKGHSALRIALSDGLLAGTNDWYLRAISVLRKEIARSNNRLFPLLMEYRYVVKILWFRVAFEEYRGDNYHLVLARQLGFELSQSNRTQIRRFAFEQPFEFSDEDSFRQHVWCLRFANDGDSVNGMDSFTARAIRVMDNMEEADACSSTTELYSRLDYGQDICKHIRDILVGKWREDFVEFVHVFKNRLSLGDVAPWLDTLYKSARRVVVGFRKKDAREAGRPDQLPEISLDYNGDVVLEPPPETSYEEGTYCNGDEFRFYRSMDAKSCANWRFIDGNFDCDRKKVLLKTLRRIEFKRPGNNDACDISKYLMTDANSGVGIYNVNPSSTSGCAYSLSNRHPIFYNDGEPAHSQKLRECEYYKVVSIKEGDVLVIAYSAEFPEGLSLPLNEFARGGETRTMVFKVPNETLRLQVGQLSFDIADSRVDKLNHNPNGRISCVKNSRGGSAGFRFFYKRDVYPVQDIAHVTGLWYEFDGCRHQLSVMRAPGQEWEAPRDWLWHPTGRLVMETADRGERAFPVTFVDVDFSEIETPPFSFGEGRHVHLRTGDAFHELDVSPNDVEVDIEYGGVHFRPQINREGVQLCLRGKVIAATNSRTPEVEVSYDDINDDAATLRIQNADAANLKFFYGDMLHPIDIRLRQDGTVPFRRLLPDVSSIKDILPIDCMISPPSGIGAYSFRIYDSKSAVLEVAHGNYEKRVVVDRLSNSDDLHIRYFASYKHHVTSNKIELAYLLSHRQDEKPRYFPLEERILADDPQGIGRCVESVVAKDFFKQDIEWGTGVIGFVVERSQFSVGVQTTGFFIAAPNPKSVCLDGDILKDLRIALSERQVRRDVPMSEDDRQRLHRIESEFMSEDVQKQEALREYIRNATNVAIELNALGSINSFCNSIRNKEGKIVWVSGFVFMAGWFVRDYIKGEAFSPDVPSLFAWWSPLLVAYKYREPCKPMSDQVAIARLFIYQSIEQLFRDGEDRHANTAEGEQMLVRLERMIGELLPSKHFAPLETDACAQGIPNNAQCVFRTTGLVSVEHSFGYCQLFKALDVLGLALHRWRMHPTLNEPLLKEDFCQKMTLQSLREYLLFVDEIDRHILNSPLCRDLVNNKSAELYFNDNK